MMFVIGVLVSDMSLCGDRLNIVCGWLVVVYRLLSVSRLVLISVMGLIRWLIG